MFSISETETFHAELHANSEWTKKLKYKALGESGLKLSTLSYGGSSLANFYGYVFLI